MHFLHGKLSRLDVPDTDESIAARGHNLLAVGLNSAPLTQRLHRMGGPVGSPVAAFQTWAVLSRERSDAASIRLKPAEVIESPSVQRFADRLARLRLPDLRCMIV